MILVVDKNVQVKNFTDEPMSSMYSWDYPFGSLLSVVFDPIMERRYTYLLVYSNYRIKTKENEDKLFWETATW